MNDQTTPERASLGLLERFKAAYGERPVVVQAPGRVNLIGEHTDYNEGFVLPAAIGFETQIALARREDRRLQVTSENYAERVEFDLDEMPASGRGHWSDYVAGVAGMVDAALGGMCGANLIIHGNVPQGAGLSSSASLEVAVCKGLLEISAETLDGASVAHLCQRAENEFVGARCGIMDQFVAVHGRRNHALRLDCRTLEFQEVPVPAGVRLAICNTMVRHSVAAGEYNSRRAECEAGARFFAERLPGVKTLRDVTPVDFEKLAGELLEAIRKRCRHVLTENARVTEAAEALKSVNLQLFGRLMNSSHTSLRDDFEVSCKELDLMVHLATQNDGVYGARMTGGGFGGCTINLVREDCVEGFRRKVAAEYERATGRAPDIYVSEAADGASRLA
ncbi:MAG TPA: galactokinase [Candidatus Limnocylindrales bacterium]|nr:galactokinase [Candidatus Limnocylindrales bacterium]